MKNLFFLYSVLLICLYDYSSSIYQIGKTAGFSTSQKVREFQSRQGIHICFVKNHGKILEEKLKMMQNLPNNSKK